VDFLQGGIFRREGCAEKYRNINYRLKKGILYAGSLRCAQCVLIRCKSRLVETLGKMLLQLVFTCIA